MTATRLQNRAVIRLSPTAAGEDVAGFLQGLLTNDVTGELPAYAALLSAQGKTMFDMIVWPGRTGEHGATILLDCEADVADDLVKRLSLYRLRRKIEIARDESLAVHWSAEPIDAHPPDPRLPALGHRWLAPADDSEPHGVSFSKGCYIGQENTARMNWRQKVNRRLVVVPLDRSEEKRRKAEYPDLGLAVDHLRVSDIPAELVPGWMRLEAAE